MKKLCSLLVIILLAGNIFCQVSGELKPESVSINEVIVSNAGWTIVANEDMGVISITHENLGLVLQNIKLNHKSKQGITLMKGWKVEKTEDRKLFVQTVHPVSAWIFELSESNLIISCTSQEMILTAEAPSTTDRIVARLLDPRGVPVNWLGTDEITIYFGGSETWNQSYLPVKNSDVMTFALGQVSGFNLHSLFDRKKDIAIEFTEETKMERNIQDQDLLDVTIPVPGNTIIRLIENYYKETLGLPFYTRFNDSVFPTAPVVWSSWFPYYDEAREEDIVRNTDWLSANLKPYGFQYIQIDDGYDKGKKEGHYWIENWNQTLYPHGPEWIAKYIKSKGLRPGLWLVPNAYGGFTEEHPEWYLHDKEGNFIIDYGTPSLDWTNPGVQEWIKKLFTTLNEWGFEYFKFDGEFSLPMYAPSVDRTKLYNKSIDPVVAYRNRLQLIRNVVGPTTFIEGCPIGTPLDGIGYFDIYFTGQDAYNSFQGFYPTFSSINANAFLNHIAVYLIQGIDVSPAMSVEEATQKMVPRFLETAKQRENPLKGFGTTLAEARTLVSYISLTGVVYSFSGIMPDLPEERTQLLKMTMPALPVMPVDLFSRGTDARWDNFKYTTTDTYIHNYPEILDLKVNAKAGVYDVVGLTNWRDQTILKEIPFSDKMGLATGVPYVVFDFWEQKLLGVFLDQIEISIEPHDTRVLLIHPKQDRPQLIGNSRHISGTFSILDLEWDSQKNSLLGLSETVPGDIYTLFIYVPDGIKVTQTKATTTGNHEVEVSEELIGNSLKFSFLGQKEAVKWQVAFSQSVGK